MVTGDTISHMNPKHVNSEMIYLGWHSLPYFFEVGALVHHTLTDRIILEQTLQFFVKQIRKKYICNMDYRM